MQFGLLALQESDFLTLHNLLEPFDIIACTADFEHVICHFHFQGEKLSPINAGDSVSMS